MENAPTVALESLDTLWFQVAGTRCNLECAHCFISCSPHNDSYGFLSLDVVRERLDESIKWGVREYYFTGGEPFLNRDMVSLLELTLKYGPATVLTNATVLKNDWVERLRKAEEATQYSLEFRVSIDGPSPETNDPVRGEGTFVRAMKGVELLVDHGFLPIITMTRVWEEENDQEVLGQFRGVLREHGYTRPRLKVLPRLKIGAESCRTEGYGQFERVTPELLDGFDTGQLVCSHSRVITDRGVAVCPILLDEPSAIMGNSLNDANRAFPLAHGACYTCYQYGAICTNPSSKPVEA
jgi:sulfatase maturation enzyme AslB (radical SAM superfamily)